MDATQHVKQAHMETNDSRGKLHIRRVLHRSWGIKHHHDRQKSDNQKRHGYHKYLSALIALLASGSPALADSVGGVSATANPIAQSSSSVQNQAIQVLQGPYIQSAVTGGVQCQGPTFNLTPFATYSNSWQYPYEAYYKSKKPVKLFEENPRGPKTRTYTHKAVKQVLDLDLCRVFQNFSFETH